VADADASETVDERARRALEELRTHEAHGRSPVSLDHELDGVVDHGLPAWLEELHARVSARWPVLDGRPGWTAGLLAVVGALLVGAGAWWLSGGGSSGGGPPATLAFTSTSGASGPTSPGGAPGSPSTAPTALVVHAAGAVHQPGVHRLEPGARVADVVAAAGGATPDADLDRLNLAALVADGERLYVPRLGQPDPPVVAGSASNPDGASAPGASSTGPVDINRATEAELDVLPGIGPTTAAAIVEHREANGPFARVDELLEVRGIGPAKLDGLREQVVAG